MSFKNTIIPEILIADLYKNIFIINPVIDPKKKVDKANTADEKTIKYLGNNLKKTVIVVKEASNVFLPENHLEFLTKILAACKLNIGDVAIVNEASAFVDINLIKKHLEPGYIILFGIDPIDLKLPFNFPHFKIQNYADSAYLSVPALDNLNSETAEGKLLKTKLWVCLKNLFDVDGGK